MNATETNTVTLADLQPTECFYFCGSNWVVIEHTNRSTISREMDYGYRKLELISSCLVEQV